MHRRSAGARTCQTNLHAHVSTKPACIAVSYPASQALERMQLDHGKPYRHADDDLRACDNPNKTSRHSSASRGLGWGYCAGSCLGCDFSP